MSASSFSELKEHVGHCVRVVQYANCNEANPPIANVAVECEDCGCVLVDYDNDEPKFTNERIHGPGCLGDTKQDTAEQQARARGEIIGHRRRYLPPVPCEHEDLRMFNVITQYSVRTYRARSVEHAEELHLRAQTSEPAQAVEEA